MGIHRLGGVLVVASVGACGIDRAGLLLARSYDAGGVGAAFDAGADDSSDDGGGVVLDFDGAIGRAGDAAIVFAIEASSAAKLPPDSGTSDGATADRDEPEEGGTRCAQLMHCCQGLIIAPPLAAACYLSAQEPDGGDGGTCGSALANLQDSGLCP